MNENDLINHIEADERIRDAAHDMLTALKALLAAHGKPMREEWINDAAFGHAKLVDAQARAAIAKAEGRT
jgi:hypothetical protein